MLQSPIGNKAIRICIVPDIHVRKGLTPWPVQKTSQMFDVSSFKDLKFILLTNPLIAWFDARREAAGAATGNRWDPIQLAAIATVFIGMWKAGAFHDGNLILSQML